MTRRSGQPQQLALSLESRRKRPAPTGDGRTQGQRRRWPGRRQRPERDGIQSHVARPTLKPAYPALVTLRAVTGVVSFRCELIVRAMKSEIRRANAKGFRVIQFSIQSNHLHLVVEGDDGLALSRGMQRLSSRLAKHVNLLLGRTGSLWRDRYFRSDLTSPLKYKRGLVYTIFNIRKHTSGAERERWMNTLDLCSSAIWVNEWETKRVLEIAKAARVREGPPPTVPAQTWTGATGWWKHHGGLTGAECPKPAERRTRGDG